MISDASVKELEEEYDVLADPNFDMSSGCGCPECDDTSFLRRHLITKKIKELNDELEEAGHTKTYGVWAGNRRVGEEVELTRSGESIVERISELEEELENL